MDRGSRSIARDADQGPRPHARDLKRARKLYGLPTNPVADVEKPPARRSGDIEVFSPEEVMALVRAAGSEQDAAIYLTAAFAGLRRGELLALSWRDVDFPAGSSGRGRATPRAR